MNVHAYQLIGAEGETYSAEAADYWMADDSTVVGDLIRTNHEYRTTTGRFVYSERYLLTDATVGDLRRLARHGLPVAGHQATLRAR